MRSLIILEVEHGEDTDGLDALIARVNAIGIRGTYVNDYTVRVDLPACFVLDSYQEYNTTAFKTRTKE